MIRKSKAEIREYYKRKRQNLALEQVNAFSNSIAEKFFENFELDVMRTIHVYIPIPGKNEVDTSRIISKIKAHYLGIKLIHPNNQKDNNVRLDKAMHIDMIIVPLICFDKNGHRLGFGGGFYDKLIKSSKEKNPKCIVIGLAYEVCKSSQNLPIEPHDQKLDYIITEKEVYKF